MQDLRTFYDTVVPSTIFFVVVYWGGESTEWDKERLIKLFRSTNSVLESPLDSIEEVVERRMLVNLASVIDSTSHPLYGVSEQHLQHQTESPTLQKRALPEVFQPN